MDDVEIKDPSAIAETFCNYFGNITAEFNIKKPSTNTISGLTMIDLRKAFDLVDHQIHCTTREARLIWPRYDSGSLVSLLS